MNEIKVKNKIRNIMEDYVFDNIKENMSLIDILYVLYKKFYNDKCKLNNKEKYNKVIMHSMRVYKNTKIIIEYLYSHHMIMSNRDKEDLMIAALFHDIGKLYKDDENHPYYSACMLECLLGYLKIMTDERLFSISKIVAMHGKKRKFRNNINYLTKILRDADLFDEVCGDSLLELALGNIESKNNKLTENLNHNDYKFSDMIIKDRNDEDVKNEILDKINIEENKELYLKLLDEAIEKYKRMTNWEIRHTKQMKGIRLMDENTIQINIK